MQGATVRIFLDRAKDYSRGVVLMRDDMSYMSSTALLAIHSAISYSDALRTTLGDENLRAADHQTAIKRLDQLLERRGVDRDGIRHLNKLVARKHEVAYGGRRVDKKALASILVGAESFAKWAIGAGRSLRAEDWIDAYH